MTRLSFALSDDPAVRELLVLEDEDQSSWREIDDEDNFETAREDDDESQAAPAGGERGTTSATVILKQESLLLFHIAAPSVLIQFSLFFIFPVSASVVGRTLGSTSLAGFALGSLVGNLTCLSICEGAMTAADTLMPRAYGSQRYDEVARLAVRALVVVTLLLLPPIVPLCQFTEWILVNWGRQDVEASRLAQEWVRYYFIGVPPNVLFRVAMRFLLAQHVTWPLVYSSLISCLFIHPWLLSLLVARMGLPGSALAIALTQYAMAGILGILIWKFQPHDPRAWPGLTQRLCQEALCRKEPMGQYLSLALGGVISLSEWWFWEIMCFVAGSFGVVAMCAHTIAYNLVPLLFMLPLGVMVGLAVRMGHIMASHDPRRAQLLALYCMGGIMAVGAVVATTLSYWRIPIIALFTKDEQVVMQCLEIWDKVCYYIFLLYIFGISSAIYRGLGLQWRLAAIVSTFLYLLLLPAVLYFAVGKGGGLTVQWTLLPLFYTFLQLMLVLGYVQVDWTALSTSIVRDAALRRSWRMAEESSSNKVVAQNSHKKVLPDDLVLFDASSETTPLRAARNTSNE